MLETDFFFATFWAGAGWLTAFGGPPVLVEVGGPLRPFGPRDGELPGGPERENDLEGGFDEGPVAGLVRDEAGVVEERRPAGVTVDVRLN